MTQPMRRSEEQLWHAFKQGDRTAFESIYRTHVQDLVNYGYRVTNNRTVIEDSIHDLFVELWQRRDYLSHTTSIKFYLFKALRNKILRQVRSDELIGSLLPEDALEPTSSYEHALIDLEVRSEQLAHLYKMINALPERQREAINLRYYHNFSNEDVAEIMGVNYQSACKFIYTALRKLKENLRISVSSILVFINFF